MSTINGTDLCGTALRSLLERLGEVRIAVIGDFCLDAYLILDQSRSEISIETNLRTRAVRTQRYTPGGAGNVAANLTSLGVGEVHAFGVMGDDLYAEQMRRVLTERGIRTEHLLTQHQEWATHVYTKMYDGDEELNRTDFGNSNVPDPETGQRLLRELRDLVPDLDCVVINEQVLTGMHTPGMRAGLVDLVRTVPGTPFICDSRRYGDEYTGTIRKLNDSEAAVLCDRGGSDASPLGYLTSREVAEMARELYGRWGKPVFVTRGENGCVAADGETIHDVPGLVILSRVDTVGAGDSMLAGLAAGLAAGAPPAQAAQLGNFVAGVTVTKLKVTGTATPEEVLGVGTDPDYRHRPDLARDPEGATWIEDTDFETITFPDEEDRRLRCAIFDHDGTISTLRQGWESLMEPLMIRAVLGRAYAEVDVGARERVGEAVRWYIDKTTGVQTLVQMGGLLDIIREFGYVSEDEMLDAPGYKEIYNRDLLDMVGKRLDRFIRGDLHLEDYTVKNSVAFVQALHERGLTLYLASGTDESDVRREADALGYARYFTGGIHGAVGDATREPKRIVLERILSDIHDASSVVTFGDGPVEMREAAKRGGLAVGVASDEVRRWGWNPAKRARLVEAGAAMIVPDFTHAGRLLSLLGV